MVLLPKGLHNILPTYWAAINRAVTSSLRKGWGHEGQSCLASIDPTTDKPLGSAIWGVVYPATTRKWVLKITADEREAVAFHDLSVRFERLRDHPGVVYFADAWQLADKTSTGAGNFRVSYTVYLLLREAVTPLANLKVSAKRKQTFNAMIDKLVKVRDLSLDYDFGTRSNYTDIMLKLAEIRQDHPELANIASFMMSYLNATHFALADIHMGNIGIRAGTKDWTIFDIGHPVTVGEPLTEPLFKVITP